MTCQNKHYILINTNPPIGCKSLVTVIKFTIFINQLISDNSKNKRDKCVNEVFYKSWIEFPLSLLLFYVLK